MLNTHVSSYVLFKKYGELRATRKKYILFTKPLATDFFVNFRDIA